MPNNLIVFVLIVLTVVLALNLHLTFRLVTIIDKALAGAQDRPFSLPVGDVLPAFEARRLSGDGTVRSDEFLGQPQVFVFVAPGCKECAKKLPEIEALMRPAATAGVGLWIITMGTPQRAQAFLGKSPCFERTLVVDAEAREKLNPRSQTPFYIFLDDKSIVQATNLIGDEDWLAFREQMKAYG
jgi:peroxiredoxin